MHLVIIMKEKHKKKREAEAEHHPVGRLAALLKEAGVKITPPETPRPAPKPAQTPRQDTAPETEDGDLLFCRAMEGVERIRRQSDSLPARLPSVPPPTDPELEDRRLLAEATKADTTFRIPDHPEYIEGWVGVAGRRFLPNLRNGTYSIQGSLDLHGMGRAEARAAVEDFVESMSKGRSCCVKIIHGRGINSPSDTAVLKEHLQRWLTTRRMARHVVAYASAPSTDGGVGAVYVLLRSR